jgi:glutamate 5-kinase
VWLDGGAVQAVQDRKKSLFSAGIVSVSGDFHAQDAVRLCDARGAEFARALINYAVEEVDKVKVGGRAGRQVGGRGGRVGGRGVSAGEHPLGSCTADFGQPCLALCAFAIS